MRDDLIALHGRNHSGIAVQLLWSRETGETFVTVVWGDRDETFQVDPSDALEAFHHPFVYGCTLSEQRHAVVGVDESAASEELEELAV